MRVAITAFVLAAFLTFGGLLYAQTDTPTPTTTTPDAAPATGMGGTAVK